MLNLKIPAWASIIVAVLIIPEYISAVFSYINPENTLLQNIAILIMVIMFVLNILIVLGYLRLAKKNKIKFLEKMLHINLIILVISYMYAILTVSSDMVLAEFIVFAAGIIGILTGIAMFKLKKAFGNIVNALSILIIVDGIFLVSIWFSHFDIFFSYPILILQAILFFKASKKYDK